MNSNAFENMLNGFVVIFGAVLYYPLSYAYYELRKRLSTDLVHSEDWRNCSLVLVDSDMRPYRWRQLNKKYQE